MDVKFTGDFVALTRFADKISGTPDILITVSEQLAEETIGLIREGFDKSEDPDGNEWDPPLLRAGKPLQDTGGLKASWYRRSSSRDGFSVASAKQYSVYHQFGTGIYGPRKTAIRPVKAKALKLPNGIFRRSVKGTKPRRMVPSSGIPTEWSRRLVETATEVLESHFNDG